MSLVAQAAEGYAREQLAERRLDALSLLAENPGADDEPTTIHLRHGYDEVVVALRESWTEPLLSTCGARVPFPVRRFEASRWRSAPGQSGQGEAAGPLRPAPRTDQESPCVHSSSQCPDGRPARGRCAGCRVHRPASR